MRGIRFLFGTTALLAGLALAPAAQAQLVINIGVQPSCPYGYYGYAPYSCAPDGYYGPGYFYNGVFLGMGPWGGWGYSHGWGGHRFVNEGGGRYHGGPGPASYRSNGGSRSGGGYAAPQRNNSPRPSDSLPSRGPASHQGGSRAPESHAAPSGGGSHGGGGGHEGGGGSHGGGGGHDGGGDHR